MDKWNAESRSALRNFLRICPEFIDTLTSASPKIVVDKGMEVGALTGAKHSGAEEIIEIIKSLSIPTESEPKSDFIDGE